MYGENYAWFTSNFVQKDWWTNFASLTNCTAYQILQASKGYIAFTQREVPPPSNHHKVTATGLVSRTVILFKCMNLANELLKLTFGI